MLGSSADFQWYVFTPSSGKALLPGGPGGFSGEAMNDLGVVAGRNDGRAATFSFATGLKSLGSLDLGWVAAPTQ